MSSFTVVSALVDIGRGRWNSGFRRSMDVYLTHLFNLTGKMDVPLLIFAEKENIPYIQEKRKGKKTFIKEISFSDYRLFPQLQRIKEIQSLPSYLAHNVVPCPEVNVPEYPVAVNNKVEFMYQASQMNPFDTEYFIWLDAGYGHSSIYIPENYKWDPQLLIEMAGDGIHINTLLDTTYTEDYTQFFKIHVDFIDGGLFIGKKEAIIKLRELYYHCIEETMNLPNPIIDDDQYYMTMVYVQNKEFFSLLNIRKWDNRRYIILP